MVTTPPDRIKHLEFIQATIARQASHSFAVKGWSLTVSAAIYAYTASHLSWWLAIVALMPAVAFACLDSFYLRQERLFRELYRDTIRPGTDVPVFDMDTRKYQCGKIYPRCMWRSTWRAGTWWGLHAPIVGAGVLLFWISVDQRLGVAELADRVRDVF